MASSSSSKDKHNFQCFTEANLELTKLPLVDILDSQIKPVDLFLKIRSLLLSGRNTLRPDQLKLCYLPPPNLPDYKTFDVTLLYTLIRNLCSGLEPTRGWGKEPGPSDTQIGDDIERLRLFRNKHFAHLSSAAIPDDTFKDLYNTLKSVFNRLKLHPGCSVDYEQELIEIKRSKFTYEKLEILKTYLERDKRACLPDEPDISISGKDEVICGNSVEFKANIDHSEFLFLSITWQKRRGENIRCIDISEEKYSGSTNSKLLIRSACKGDEGEYSAFLSIESNGKKYKLESNTISLLVVGERPFLNDLEVSTEEEKIIIHYNYGVLEKSPKVQHIEWRKNDKLLNLEDEKYIGGNLEAKTFTLFSPSNDNRGKYSCTVTNAVGPVTKHVDLDIPRVELSVESTGFFGSKATIRSNVYSCPLPERVQWQKSNNKRIFLPVDITAPAYSGSTDVPRSAILVIPKLSFDEKLFYRLLVWNKIGQNYSNPIYLNVTGSPPNITVSQETNIKNKSVKLCGNVFVYDNSPGILSVYWAKDGKKIDITENGGKFSQVTIDEPSLNIKDVNLDDIGDYQLTATNAVGSTKSDVIKLGPPSLLLEKQEDKNTGRQQFTLTIKSFPAPCDIRWSAKVNDDDIFTPIDMNAEEYKGTTVYLPHPVLVVNQGNQLENYTFKIEVNSFVGSTIEVFSGQKYSSIAKKEDSMENTLYEDKGAGLKFALLNIDLANQFPVEKVKLLKFIIQSSGKVEDVTSLKSADSAMECFTILQDENIFSKRDVIFVQFLCKVTGCKELYDKCKDYALSQKALCCFERQVENGYTKVQFHVQGDLNNYTRENIINIVETVAGILNCRTDEILVNGVYHSGSFMLVLSMKDIYIKKWMNLSERDCHHLTSLHIDYFILNQKSFQLESSKDLVESKIAVLDKELQFAKLCGDLAKDFPRQKFQQLRSILSDSTRKMESLMPANSVLECFAYLLEKNLFSKEDVSFIQFLCKKTNCEELHKKCVEYAQGQELQFFEEGVFEGKIYHSIDKTYTTYRVHQCSKCPGDKIYYCESCPCALCPRCKEKHVKDLRTIDHTVVTFHEKLNYIPSQEVCVRHPGKLYRTYCEPCNLPVCFHCRKHRNHKQLKVKKAFEKRRRQHSGIIYTIRSEALFYRPVLLSGIRSDFKTCRTELSLHQSDMLTKAQRLKDLIDYMVYDLLNNVFCYFDFKHRCKKQKIKMTRHIVILQEYERRYVHPEFTFSALQFLFSMKKPIRKLQLHHHTSQLSMTESFNKEDVMESLSAIQITERGNRRVGNQGLLKMTSGPELHQCLTLTDVDSCKHISCVTSSRAWVSDNENKLIQTNNTGATLQYINELYTDGYGLHTVNSEGDLFYISENFSNNFSINKRSEKKNEEYEDMKNTIFIKSALKPGCVYLSPSSGDILIGMYREKLKTGKVTRYKQSGQLTQTIQYAREGFKLYRQPRYITENNNWDVVVSDYDGKSGAVVVTEREGEPRFFYTGHPSGSGLRPRGICTDALSHILVCDDKTHTVQIIDRDGKFLSHLLIRPSGIFYPHSLSYDVNTHRVWVGSQDNNKVVIYNYIQRATVTTDVTESLSELTTTETELSDLIPVTTDVTESLSKLTTTETEISATVDEMESFSELATIESKCTQEGNDSQLKLMDSPTLVHFFTVNDVRYCYHISFVTADQVWVSDRKTLIMTNGAGDTLHRVEDICSDLRGVLHTVNNRGELLYIDSNYNIKKLSSDMETATTFIKRPTSAWEPRCVYWSPSTRDLLVGMCKYRTGMITRYNQSGQQTQTIKHDNTGLELYREPNYIIELNNGDVVVSDAFSAVVVTGRGGRHRFSYTGHPSGSGLEPRGISTDTLSHIIVCDDKTKLIHIINKDGQFLSHLEINSSDICSPYSLCYDANTHFLWVGSGYNNELCVYRYIERMDTQIDQSIRCLDEFAFASCSSRPAWR